MGQRNELEQIKLQQTQTQNALNSELAKNEKFNKKNDENEEDEDDKIETIQNEIRQKMAIELKTKYDIEYNEKMESMQEKFALQVESLQHSLNESHRSTNAMRLEIEEQGKKYIQLQSETAVKREDLQQSQVKNNTLIKELEVMSQKLSAQTKEIEEMKLYKQRIEEYEEEKDALLQEKDLLRQQLDEERMKIDEIREDFKRKEQLFGAKEKQQINLLNKQKKEKEAIKNQLSAHSEVIKKSHHLLAKQNNLLKQRESKIYSLVEKQSAYLDSMAALRDIQIKMDEDFTKKMLSEEEENEQRRLQELEEQRRRDEEFVKKMLLQEKKSKSNLSSVADKKSENLSQQIASVALAQQRERLSGNKKKKKNVLDLWIKSQMQLMCGQLPSLCKKYGIQLDRLEDVYASKKRSFQPQYDATHYLKFRDDHYDPKEFETKRKSKRLSINSAYSSSLSPSSPSLSTSSNPLLDNLDPYGHYDDDLQLMAAAEIVSKPKGFVYAENGDPNIAQQQTREKKKKFSIFKRKSK